MYLVVVCNAVYSTRLPLPNPKNDGCRLRSLGSDVKDHADVGSFGAGAGTVVSTVCLRGAVFIATNCYIQVLEEAGLLAKDASVFFYDKNMNLIENMGNKQVRCGAVPPRWWFTTVESKLHSVASANIKPEDRSDCAIDLSITRQHGREVS